MTSHMALAETTHRDIALHNATVVLDEDQVAAVRELCRRGPSRPAEANTRHRRGRVTIEEAQHSP